LIGAEPTPAEKWLPVAGYEGRYEVSDLGRVRRVAGGPGARAGRILRRLRAGRGYYQVFLGGGTGSRPRPHKIHKLVAEAFHGPRPEGRHINHKDADKRNNAAENLEYVSHGENAEHAARNGLNAAAKLTPESVRRIRKLAGQPPREGAGRVIRRREDCDREAAGRRNVGHAV
jgi:hypothetical protein